MKRIDRRPAAAARAQIVLMAESTMSDDDYIIRPNPHDPRLTERVTGVIRRGRDAKP